MLFVGGLEGLEGQVQGQVVLGHVVCWRLGRLMRPSAGCIAE